MERISVDIDDLFASDRDLCGVLEEVARLGVRQLMRFRTPSVRRFGSASSH